MYYGRDGYPRSFSPGAFPRIDCGATVVGVGEVVFCGGCGSHPNQAGSEEYIDLEEAGEYSGGGGDDDERVRGSTGGERGFFASARVYDSIFGEWRALPEIHAHEAARGVRCVCGEL